MAAENVANAQWRIETKGYQPLTLEAEEIPVLYTDVAAKASDSAYAPSLFGFNDTGYQSFKAIALNFPQSEHDPAIETGNSTENEHVHTPAIMSNEQFYMENHDEKTVALKEKPNRSSKKPKKSVRYGKRKR